MSTPTTAYTSSQQTFPYGSQLDLALYPPAVYGNTLYSGGWLNQTDRDTYYGGINGVDQLYTSPAGQDTPTPLHWNGSIPYYFAHINDPSVVAAPDGSGLVMFMTVLPNSTPGDFNSITNHNLTVLARSTDGGQTWTFDSVVIGQNNGVSNTGAWSPSAMANGNQVDLW